MVISFEEKDRAAIEANGITIIEFKSFLYKMADWIKRAVESMIELVHKIAEPLTDTFKEFAEKISSLFEDVKDWYFNLPETERHKIVKWYAKANNQAMIVSRRRVYHCRDKC